MTLPKSLLQQVQQQVQQAQQASEANVGPPLCKARWGGKSVFSFFVNKKKMQIKMQRLDN